MLRHVHGAVRISYGSTVRVAYYCIRVWFHCSRIVAFGFGSTVRVLLHSGLKTARRTAFNLMFIY